MKGKKGGWFQTGMLFYLGLTLAVVFAAPQIVFPSSNPASATVLSWFNLQYNATSGDIITIPAFASASNAANTSFGTPTSPAGQGSILGFIDPIFQIFGWISLIFNVIFSPIILFTASGAPWTVVLLIALPITFMMIIGLIIWIRSGFP